MKKRKLSVYLAGLFFVMLLLMHIVKAVEPGGAETPLLNPASGVGDGYGAVPPAGAAPPAEQPPPRPQDMVDGHGQVAQPAHQPENNACARCCQQHANECYRANCTEGCPCDHISCCAQIGCCQRNCGCCDSEYGCIRCTATTTCCVAGVFVSGAFEAAELHLCGADVVNLDFLCDPDNPVE